MNVDIFNDGKLQFDKPKADPKPEGVYVGRNHKYLSYGQTGIGLYNSKWELEFFPDGEEHGVKFIIDKKDLWYTDETREFNINPYA